MGGVLGHQLHFFFINLTKKVGNIDALDEVLNIYSELLVILLQRIVLFDHLGVRLDYVFVLNSQTSLLCLELLELDLGFDQVFTVRPPLLRHFVSFWLGEIPELHLCIKLCVKHEL